MIRFIFLISVLYWSFLALSSSMIIAQDATTYEELGRSIYNQGFIPAYFKTAPNREPVYPLLIALAMHLEHGTGVVYTKIMAFLGVLILLLTQFLLYLALKHLQVRQGIIAVALLYFAVSPAVNNAALSLYSEIAAFPIIIGVVHVSARALAAIKRDDLRRSIGWGLLLGLLLAGATLTKAVFEGISPLYLVGLVAASLLAHQRRKKTTWPWLIFLGAALFAFYAPVAAYKNLNQQYNGNYALTGRASWALYGNAARRMEPLTPHRLGAALAYAPGEGLCASFFDKTDCTFWSFQRSDDYGMTKLSQLTQQGLDPQEINRRLLRASADLIIKNPLQFAFLSAVEATKLLFWESTQIGFVQYPSWLEKIYNNGLFKNLLRLLMGLLTLMAVAFVWVRALYPSESALLKCTGLLVLLFMSLYSFFFILTRYALPVAPLFLIAIATTADFLYNKLQHHGQPQ